MTAASNLAVRVACAFCCFVLSSAPAWAEVTANDMQIAGRALSFLQKPLTGEVILGIVYAPEIPQSVREAENLLSVLGARLKVGNIVLKPALVKLDEAARADVGLLFLAPGVGTDAKKVAEVIRTRRIPCITTDIAQVRAGFCTMGITSRPKVEILVNRVSAASSAIAFSAVFRIMITEI
jgi:hypothetical protein